MLLLMLALVSVGCTAWPVPPTEPPMVGEPLPGSFYLTTDPPLAPYALTIRADFQGGPSGRNAKFEAGAEIVVNWSDLPLPRVKWIEVNGQDCEGTFEIRARFQTDLLLFLEDGPCRVEVRGMHPEDDVQDLPGE